MAYCVEQPLALFCTIHCTLKGMWNKEKNLLLDLPWDIVEEVLQYLTVSDILRLECSCRKGRQLSIYYWRRIKKLELLSFLNNNNVDVSNAYR